MRQTGGAADASATNPQEAWWCAHFNTAFVRLHWCEFCQRQDVMKVTFRGIALAWIASAKITLACFTGSPGIWGKVYRMLRNLKILTGWKPWLCSVISYAYNLKPRKAVLHTYVLPYFWKIWDALWNFIAYLSNSFITYLCVWRGISQFYKNTWKSIRKVAFSVCR